jgi:Rrf2 family nitric oxide-sensitive transcriptional repressor
MQLTTSTDYTLRVLMYLALATDERVTIQEIAEAYGISRNHLVKIVHDLGREGLVETTQGRSGGIRLAVPPETVEIGNVVRRSERNFSLVACFSDSDAACRVEPACVLSSVLDEALTAFLDVLDGYTLADLVRPRKRLRQLLAIAG